MLIKKSAVLVTTSLTAAALLAGAVAAAVPAQAAAPAVGQCFTYTLADIDKGQSASGAVDCTAHHTAETFFAGTAKGGYSLPSKATPAQLLSESAPCTLTRMNAALGLEGRQLPSRFLPVVMLPTDAQWQAGEKWMRCDVVLQGGTHLVTTTGTGAALVARSLPTQFDFCTFGEPNARNTSAYPCTEPKKNWIKVLDKDLGGPGSKFPGRGVENRTRSICEKQGKKWNGGEKWPGWWAIWPTSVGWKEGRRSAQCFVPYKQYAKELAQHAPKPAPSAGSSPADSSQAPAPSAAPAAGPAASAG